MPQKSSSDHVKVATEFFRMVGDGKMKEALRFFSPNCRQHNPFVHGGMAALLKVMATAFGEGTSQFGDSEFRVANVLSDGDLVAVHTELLNSKRKPREGGVRQVHIFRFKGDKIVEYWDVSQQITPEMPNASEAF
ncbi:MAG TPA: nuclear transport factor 2 family protein [Nitrososphaerales archaeon]|nr:nuclear transport factor 2 family protein [Nitrososphaerales archaeon]